MQRRTVLSMGTTAAALALLPGRLTARQDRPKGARRMRIVVTSVMVDDQDKAFRFYTEILGFVKKTHIPDIQWLTVVSPESPDGVELLLEPLGFPPAKAFQKALLDAGIPWNSFAVDNVQQEFDRLTSLGVVFRRKPLKMGPVTTAVFEDTCGNLMQIAQQG